MRNSNNETSACNAVVSTCLLIAAVSFGGFIVENVFVAVTLGYVDNRNMVLPFLLGYGLAMAAIYLLFGKPDSPRLFGFKMPDMPVALRVICNFVAVFVFVSVGEHIVGMLAEELCNVTWWDYSQIPLNFTKFTSAPTGLGFTAAIMLFNRFLYEPLIKLFGRMNKKVLYILAASVAVLLIADCVYSLGHMYRTNDFMTIWRIDLR